MRRMGGMRCGGGCAGGVVGLNLAAGGGFLRQRSSHVNEPSSKQPDGRKNSRNSCQHIRACNILAWMAGRAYGLSDPEDDHCTKGDTNNAESLAHNNEGVARR